jgi:hypothetical protein
MRSSKTGLQAAGDRDNLHVSNILPVTTLRTIDLGGKKKSDSLFSRFWAETRFFFEVNSGADACFHHTQERGALALFALFARRRGF